MHRRILITALTALALLLAVATGGRRDAAASALPCCCSVDSVDSAADGGCCGGGDADPLPPCACDSEDGEFPFAPADPSRERGVAALTPRPLRIASLHDPLRTLWIRAVPAVARTGPPVWVRHCVWLI